MRKAMSEAVVGDDVLGEDPTIARLEETAAEMFNMESGLFVASGTQGNLLALFSHCQRGDEYIAGQTAHNYLEEGGGGAILASIQPQPVANELDGTLSLDHVKDLIKPEISISTIFCISCWLGCTATDIMVSKVHLSAPQTPGLRFIETPPLDIKCLVSQDLSIPG